MAQGADQSYEWHGCLYIPINAVRLSAGPFLPVSPNGIEQHLQLPPALHHGAQDGHKAGFRMHRKGLAAAWVHGDSMIYRHVLDGDIAIFQRSEFDDLKNGVMVIEKLGEEEGFGAWALKKIVIERHRSSYRNEYQDEIDWDDPVVVLHSCNPRVGPWSLDPFGQYRVRGIFPRSLRRPDARMMDSDIIRRIPAGE